MQEFLSAKQNKLVVDRLAEDPNVLGRSGIAQGFTNLIREKRNAQNKTQNHADSQHGRYQSV